jgi:hypothetical protein
MGATSEILGRCVTVLHGTTLIASRRRLLANPSQFQFLRPNAPALARAERERLPILAVIHHVSPD